MDTAKSVAHPAGLPLVIVPTIASTDAPTSALAVVYTEEGEFLERLVCSALLHLRSSGKANSATSP